MNYADVDPDKKYPESSIMTYEDAQNTAVPYLAVVKNG